MRRLHAHLVSHTHWDRAWYLPFQRFRVHLLQFVDGLLDLLEREPRFVSFTLDGQMALVDDYLALRPENRERIARLVRAGRLEVGPWFVLPDAFLPSGEALIRNLKLGLDRARGLGAAPRDGYMPDSFGHVEQMPQLLGGFGMRSFLFMRGLAADDWQRLGCEFDWVAPDGSRVLAIYLRESYLDSSALGLPEAFGDFEGIPPRPELAIERIRASLASRVEQTPSGVILLLNGCDHMPFQPELPELLDTIRPAFADVDIEHGTIGGYVDDVLAAGTARASFHGDLLGNAHHPVLSNVWSTRIPLKQANWQTQWLLEQVAEPLCAAAGRRGAELAAAVDEAWRLLLLNHAHDDICGCSVDPVHEDDAVRFREVAEIADEVASECVRAIARREGLVREGRTQWLFTLDPNAEGTSRVVEADVFFPAAGAGDGYVHDADAAGEARSPATAAPRTVRLFDSSGDEVPVQILERDEHAFRALRCDTGSGTRFRIAFTTPPTEGLGIGFWRVEPCESAGSPPARDRHVLENPDWRIAVHDDGRIDLHHLQLGVRLDDALAFESVTDAGDEYSHGPVPGETPVTSRGTPPISIRWTASGPVFDELEVGWHLVRPRSLDDRTTVELPVALRLRLPRVAGDPELRAVVDNVAEDHRLRLTVATGGRAREALASGAFTITSRCRVPDDSPEPAPGYPGERVYPTQFSRDFVFVRGERGDVVVAHRGLHEYELVDGPGGRTDLALTVLRAVGMLSRGDGHWRKVQAGPSLSTPGAQCPGRHVAELALTVLRSRSPATTAARHAAAFTRPIYATQARLVPFGEGSGPSVFDHVLVDVDDRDVMVSALYPGGDAEHLVVRVWNRADVSRRTCLALGDALLAGRGIVHADLTDLDESPAGELAAQANFVMLELAPFRIQTVRFTLESK